MADQQFHHNLPIISPSHKKKHQLMVANRVYEYTASTRGVGNHLDIHPLKHNHRNLKGALTKRL